MEEKASQGSQGVQRVLSWEVGALPSVPHVASTSWVVPGTSPVLLPVYVESVLLKPDLVKTLMIDLDI